MNSNQKGNIAEQAIALEAMKLGIPVLKPMAEHERYDLAFDLGSRILRVQCKWAQRKDGVVCVHLSRCRTSRRGYVRATYLEHEIDAFAAYCHDLDRSYLFPASLAAGQYMIHLRLTPPKNAQRASLNWAQDYEMPGAVAQLGERAAGSRQVGGSSPPSSTPPIAPGAVQVGAHEFRNHFGYYMERAVAGEDIARRSSIAAIPALAASSESQTMKLMRLPRSRSATQ
jgi:hypothetical protein